MRWILALPLILLVTPASTEAQSSRNDPRDPDVLLVEPCSVYDCDSSVRYRIRLMDVVGIRLTDIQKRRLHDEYHVRVDSVGMITVRPLDEDVQAAGLTQRELRQVLVRKLAKFSLSPEVEVKLSVRDELLKSLAQDPGRNIKRIFKLIQEEYQDEMR